MDFEGVFGTLSYPTETSCSFHFHIRTAIEAICVGVE